MKAQDKVSEFFDFTKERLCIHQFRSAGGTKPWSEDPIFQTEYFCNVFREDDKTTKWFRENIRDKVKNEPREALAAIAAFRWFNKIATGEKIKEFLLGEWDSVKVHNKLAHVRPVVTGAYIIKTPDGMNKLKGVLWCIDKFIENMDKGTFTSLFYPNCSMKVACETLKESPFLGNFMSWQICSDARQTILLQNAPDRDTWAQPGPGSTRGLGRVFYNNVEHFNYGSKSDETEMLKLMNVLAEQSRDHIWNRPLAVIDISHTLCEYDKYERCKEGGRMKRKYNAS